MRGILEFPDKTAALVTPDRALAQRVATELGRWGVTADDSAGVPLSVSPLGAFSRLLLRAVLEDFTPAAVMALASHPCLALEGREAA